MSTAAFGRVPFIPHDALRALHVHEPTDDRFRAAARARQALLREAKGWPIGMWAPDTGKARELGSYLDQNHSGRNFITSEIFDLARREVGFREDGALFDTDRLYRNMLSSMPATFNLLGAMALNPRLATLVMRRLCPGFVKKVKGTVFEHSPARRHPAWTNDRSAWDALFKITTTTGEHGFVACEVKFTELMHDRPARHRIEYDALSAESDLFVDPNHPALRAAPLQQLWRSHMLAYAAIKNGLYSVGRFIIIAPTLNRAAQEAIAQYRAHLLPGGIIPFDAISYEQVIEAIRRSGGKDTAALLTERYLDFTPVDALIG
jgi:hypothetical protein